MQRREESSHNSDGKKVHEGETSTKGWRHGGFVHSLLYSQCFIPQTKNGLAVQNCMALHIVPIQNKS